MLGRNLSDRCKGVGLSLRECKRRTWGRNKKIGLLENGSGGWIRTNDPSADGLTAPC